MVGVSTLLQVPSICLTVLYGHGGLGVVIGAEHVPDAVKYVPGGQGRGVSIFTQEPSGCLVVPNGHEGRGVVGVAQIPELVKYVPGGHVCAVVVGLGLRQLPSVCSIVPYGHDGR